MRFTGNDGDDSGNKLDKAMEYDGGRIVSFNSLSGSDHAETRTSQDSTARPVLAATVADPEIADSLDDMYMGTYGNTMVFRLSYIENNIYSYLSQCYAGDGFETTLTLSWSEESSRTLESSISNSVSRTLGLSSNSSFEDHLTMYGETKLSTEIAAGSNVGIGFVETDLETKIGTEVTTGLEVEVVNTMSWGSNIEQHNAREYTESQAEAKSSINSESYTKHFIAEEGYYYRCVYLSNTFVNQIVEFEEIDGKAVTVSIKYVVSYTEPSIYLLKSDSRSFGLKNNRHDCSLTEEQISAAIERYGGELDFTDPEEEIAKGGHYVVFHADGMIYDRDLVRNGERFRAEDFVETANGYTESHGQDLKWSFTDPTDPTFDRDCVMSLDACLSAMPVILEENADVYMIPVPEGCASYEVITNETELRDIGDDLDGKFVMVRDIQLQNGWTPIGMSNGNYKPFTGVLNGGGHTISGMDIHMKCPSVKHSDMGSSSNNKYAFTGMFSILGLHASVSDIVLKDSNVNPVKNEDNGWQTTGAIAGYARGANIDNILLDNVHVTMNKTSKCNSVAGMVLGIMEYGCRVSDCVVSSTCSLYSNGNNAYAGGIVGSMENEAGTVDHCINMAKISARGYGGAFDYKDAVGGGISGCAKFSGSKTIDHCLNGGEIHTDIDWTYRDAGGMVGRNYNKNVTISNCAMVKGLLYEGGTCQGDKYIDGGSGDTAKTNNHMISEYNLTQIPGWDLDSPEWNSDVYIEDGEYRIHMG